MRKLYWSVWEVEFADRCAWQTSATTVCLVRGPGVRGSTPIGSIRRVETRCVFGIGTCATYEANNGRGFVKAKFVQPEHAAEDLFEQWLSAEPKRRAVFHALLELNTASAVR